MILIQDVITWASLLVYVIFLSIMIVRIRRSESKPTACNPLQAPLEPSCCDNVNIPKSHNYSIKVENQ